MSAGAEALVRARKAIYQGADLKLICEACGHYFIYHDVWSPTGSYCTHNEHGIKCPCKKYTDDPMVGILTEIKNDAQTH